MKFLDKLARNLNPTQKKIVGVSVALVLLIICLAFADEVGSGSSPVFDWKDNWFVWVIFLSAIGYFEYRLFQDPIIEE